MRGLLKVFVLSLVDYDEIYVRLIMVDTRLKELNIVVSEEAFCQKSSAQNRSSLEESFRMIVLLANRIRKQ